MNTFQSKPVSSPAVSVWQRPMWLWRRYQIYRGNRMHEEADRRIDSALLQIREAKDLRAKGAKLIGDNAKAPGDLFDC